MKGVFIGLTEAEILEIRAQAQEDSAAGRPIVGYTSPSGLSVQKALTNMHPGECLLECRYALQKLNPATYGRDLITTRTRAKHL